MSTDRPELDMPNDPTRGPNVSSLLAQDSTDICGPWTRFDCPTRRIRWILALEGSPDATAGLREPIASSFLSSVEDDHEGSGSSEISLAAASQAEVASPFRHLSRCDSSPHGAPCVCLSGLDDVRDHRCPITAAQHVAALSMPFDPSAVSRSRCTFKVSNRPCDPTHPSKCSRASTHSLPEQGPTAPVTGAPMALLGVYAGCPDYFDDARDLYVRRVDAGDSDLLAMSYALHSATAPANYAPETWPDVSRGDRMVVRWLARNVAVI